MKAGAAVLGAAGASFVAFEKRPSGIVVPKTRMTPAGPISDDAFVNLRRYLDGKHRISLGGAIAHADPVSDMCVVHIKVMNHVNTPLCFRLGAITGSTTTGQTTSGPQSLSGASRLTTSAALLGARGIEELPPATGDLARYGALRMNRWFATMLHTGMFEGANNADVAPGGLTAATFPGPSDVAIQVMLGVGQSDPSLNHGNDNCGMVGSSDPAKGGDLSFHVNEQGVIKSPLGIVCFNMGGLIEVQGVRSAPNRVYRSGYGTAVAEGRAVAAYGDVVRQAVSAGLVDADLVEMFDNMVGAPAEISKTIRDSKTALTNALTALASAGSIENMPSAVSGLTTLERGAKATPPVDVGAGAQTGEVDASLEFVSQCQFVRAALDIPGKPFRNFTLVCHVADVDGVRFDTGAIGQDTVGAIGGSSYVEGMRQLAVGLNILAQAIKAHRQLYVVVTSEGGRGFNGNDNKVSHAIVLGPGGAGGLTDALYADMNALTNNAAFVSDPNNPPATGNERGVPISTNDVVTEAGGPVTGGAIDNTKILIGLVRQIETAMGATKSSAEGLGAYLKLRTA